MGVREFLDEDAGYLAWLAAHADGDVINIALSHSTSEARPIRGHVGLANIFRHSPTSSCGHPTCSRVDSRR